jgi:hypothetical protein
MNLSARSVDKELLSRVNVKDTMNLSARSVDKELCLKENFIFNEIH